jgi:hypothetical protein
MCKKMGVLLGLFTLAVTISILPQAKGQAKDKTKDVNISGVWELTWATNNRTADVTFIQEKEALKVTIKPPQEDGTTGTGTIKANVVEWSMTVSGPQGDFKLLFKGKVEGDTMSGEAQMGDTGTYNWTAKKKK